MFRNSITAVSRCRILRRLHQATLLVALFHALLRLNILLIVAIRATAAEKHTTTLLSGIR